MCVRFSFFLSFILIFRSKTCSRIILRPHLTTARDFFYLFVYFYLFLYLFIFISFCLFIFISSYLFIVILSDLFIFYLILLIYLFIYFFEEVEGEGEEDGC